MFAFNLERRTFLCRYLSCEKLRVSLVKAPNKHISTTTVSEIDNFDLSDKTLPLIFQIIKSSQYTKVNNISLKTSDMIFLHDNIRSIQKNCDELNQFVGELPLKLLITSISETK